MRFFISLFLCSLLSRLVSESNGADADLIAHQNAF